jgi:hypothetical protein
MRPQYPRILEHIQITEIVTYSFSNSFRESFCLEGHFTMQLYVCNTVGQRLPLAPRPLMIYCALTMQLVLRLHSTEFTGKETERESGCYIC